MFVCMNICMCMCVCVYVGRGTGWSRDSEEERKERGERIWTSGGNGPLQ